MGKALSTSLRWHRVKSGGADRCPSAKRQKLDEAGSDSFVATEELSQTSCDESVSDESYESDSSVSDDDFSDDETADSVPWFQRLSCYKCRLF